MSLKRTVFLALAALLVALPVVAQSDSIDFGDSVDGEVTEANPTAEYTFTGEAGQLVVITLTSDDYDSYLILQDEDGTTVAENDDAAGNLNSRIGPFALPQDGEYTIIADSYDHYFNSSDEVAEGSFTLMLEEADARNIEYTQNVKGELTSAADQEFYVFRGQAGDVVNISATADDGGILVTLGQGDTTLMSADSTYSDNDVAQIAGYSLPETGNYIITVNSPAGDETSFSLLLDRLEVTPINYGDTVEADFDEANSLNYYTFEGEAGDVVDVTVVGDGDFDSQLTINGPDNYQVGYADDTNDLDPAISDLILSTSGTYTILLQPYTPGDEGTVSLTLDLGELDSLDDGPLTVNLTSDQLSATVAFDGVAGETARIVVEVIKGDSASPYLTLSQGATSLAYASGSSISRMAIDFDVLDDGQVFVRVEDSSYTDVSLRVSVERGGEGMRETVDEVVVEETPVVATAEPAATEAIVTEVATEEPAATEVAPPPVEETVVAPEATEPPAPPVEVTTVPEAPAATAEATAAS